MNKLSSGKKNQSILIDRIEELEIERAKLEYIIDSLQHGLVVFNNEGLIQIINNYARELFNFKLDDIRGKTVVFLTRNIELQKIVEEAVKTKQKKQKDITINNKIYQVELDPIPATSPKLGFNQGVVLVLIDVTENRKVAQMKREFFANASHELKSPLTTIIGYQQLLVEKILDDPEELDNTQRKILKESYRMNKIITEMLELSRLESESANLTEKTNLLTIISEILVSYKQQINDKNITVNSNLHDSYHQINNMHADQIIRNLIDNAINYNDIGGKLIVELTQNYFLVEDTGIGIPPEDINRIFERFYRVDKARSKSEGGTGLGLAIVKHVAGLYGYDIKVESKLGIGTKIKVTFTKGA